MRASPAEYLRLDLRAHDLLRDVPLYDVSIVDFPGGGVPDEATGSFLVLYQSGEVTSTAIASGQIRSGRKEHGKRQCSLHRR